ncbi:hypothetical protein [Aquamicrobium zhengzhouense]|uniref:Uncharacterized protein n=1 Tax=Aquamicrobium zhengzhouense TaxID=2781738 RepID=A0ABS0SCF3_9HYPH|nr:hypothetical protein [Aquamicrobium zhengzhouense]MBI1620982.1 hypothetical protein [Aquamicrobium zhengzhouense]
MRLRPVAFIGVMAALALGGCAGARSSGAAHHVAAGAAAGVVGTEPQTPAIEPGIVPLTLEQDRQVSGVRPGS